MISLCRVPMFLYFIREYPDGPIKIGIASNVLKRLDSLQTGNPRRLVIELAVPAGHSGRMKRGEFEDRPGGRGRRCVEREDPDSAKATERRWHERFAHLRMIGEWFRPDEDLLLQISSLRAWAARTPEAGAWLG